MFAREHAVSECVGCGRLEPIRKQYCRLCWAQARAQARESGDVRWAAIPSRHLGQVRHHQLFFANMASMRGSKTTPPRMQEQRGRPRKQPPPPAGRPASTWVQPFLFDGIRRDYTRFDEKADANPDNPWLVWGNYLAHRIGEARGWSRRLRFEVQRALVILLSLHVDGDMVSYTAMSEVLRPLDLSCDRTADVLTEMGILVDDRRSSFEDWLTGKLEGIAPGIARETETWLRTLRDGGPRIQPRSIQTVRLYARTVRPVLIDWSQRHDHLREITRDEVLAVLDSLHGKARQDTLIGLRSLFGFCKKHGIVFRNPTSRIRVGNRVSKLIQPLEPAQIQRTAAGVTGSADRLILALAAVHAARPGAIRALRLDEVDLGDRRLTIAGRPRPLDDLTHRILSEWLDYRRTRWPDTANPHMLINQMTALETGPVSAYWISAGFRGQQATIERLRVDRQLEEALTHGPDPLHLAVVFDLDAKTAIRYANSARQLLQTPIECDTTG